MEEIKKSYQCHGNMLTTVDQTAPNSYIDDVMAQMLYRKQNELIQSGQCLAEDIKMYICYDLPKVFGILSEKPWPEGTVFA